MKSEIGEIIERIKRFRDERDWEQFHDAKNLAICLNIESAELLELFLWKNSEEANKEKVKNELADVFYAAFLIADKYDFDVKELIFEKLKSNELKYPIDRSRGSNKKYTEL
ncbi:MAG: nucleotide pyrophosphohydrolase [Saprospiraceae bacterium]|nr:nucleotide pyrophosphohydrolase [Saprospiraceae bacterium]